MEFHQHRLFNNNKFKLKKVLFPITKANSAHICGSENESAIYQIMQYFYTFVAELEKYMIMVIHYVSPSKNINPNVVTLVQ